MIFYREDAADGEIAGDTPRFAVEDPVIKIGDYSASGIVRAVFPLGSGVIRYAVEHRAEISGSYVHVYAEKNLIPDERVSELSGPPARA